MASKWIVIHHRSYRSVEDKLTVSADTLVARQPLVIVMPNIRSLKGILNGPKFDLV